MAYVNNPTNPDDWRNKKLDNSQFQTSGPTPTAPPPPRPSMPPNAPANTAPMGTPTIPPNPVNDGSTWFSRAVAKGKAQNAPVTFQPAGAPTTGGGNAAGITAGNAAEYAFQNIDSTIPLEQWKAWEGQFDSSCPPGTPYRSSKVGPNGQVLNTCEEKPDNCPHGMTAFGQNQCLPVNDPRVAWSTGAGRGGAGGAGGSGAGGGGGMSGSASWKGLGPESPYSQTVWNSILARLNGETRYTPAVMSSLLGQTKMASEAMKTQQTDEALANMARRGMARAPVNNAVFRDINAQASGQMLGAQNQLLRAKVDADYQDKTAAIESAQKWLDSMRDYVARMEGTQAQKEAAMANVTLGYARLRQEMDMMREEYAQQLNSRLFGGGY